MYLVLINNNYLEPEEYGVDTDTRLVCAASSKKKADEAAARVKEEIKKRDAAVKAAARREAKRIAQGRRAKGEAVDDIEVKHISRRILSKRRLLSETVTLNIIEVPMDEYLGLDDNIILAQAKYIE